MTASTVIWTNESATGRDQYALFRRAFELKDPRSVESANFRIFADSRYRLIVNGRILPHGPVRFYPEHPPYDEHDLRPFLRAGRNAIAVLVCSFGTCRNFQAEPGPGGLLTWGEIIGEAESIGLESSRGWKALDAEAFDSRAPKMSFALNPAEILDSRRLPAEWDSPDFDDSAWPAASEVRDQEHWGAPEPRPIDFLNETPVRPASVSGVFAASHPQDEEILSFRLVTEPLETGAPAVAAVFAWIHSPRGQEVTYGGWWGEHWINGEHLEGESIKGRDYRKNRTVCLREGWNRFVLFQPLQFDVWGCYLALPKEAGLTVSAEKDLDCPDAFLAACWTGEDASGIAGLEWPLQGPEQLPKGLGSLQAQPRGDHAGLPFYDRAWLDFRPIAAAMPIDDLDWDALSHQLRSNEKLVLGLDFEREILGRPRVGFNAEPGGILDISYSERANGQGLPQVAYRYQVEMGERCIARGGSQQWHLFHPRGFRYLELIVHQPQTFTLDDLDVTQFIYPTPEQEGEFRCSDPLLEKIWRAGAEALRVNKEDVYMDCPHRERGLYVGDSLVEFMADRASFGDTDIFRRSLELYWHSQGSNGLVKPAAHHSYRHGSHPDYSALMPQLLWTWFEATGDLDLVRRYRDQVLKLVEGLLSLRDDDGVYSDCGMNSYIDIARTARRGPSCAMNCFVKEAFASVGRLMPLLDEAEEGRRWEGEAARVSEMIRAQFFDPDVNRFLDYPGTSEYERGYSVHGNTLALLYGVADKSRAQPIVDWICGELENNFHNDPPRNGEDLNVNAYFSYYTLGALLDHGRLDEALRFIRKCWGSMIERGAWATWEYFYDKGSDSLCHAWAAAPTWYLSSRVLGVRFPEPGNPDKVTLAPEPGDLDWAEGVFPHPRGPLKVRWERRGDSLKIDYEAPDPVEIIL